MRSLPKYCSGKRAYTKKGAQTAVNKRFKEDRVLLRIYPCRSHWHLTKLKAKRKPKINHGRNYPPPPEIEL